jgi:hypothetical protein
LAGASRPVALPPRANHPLLLDANASAPFISALSGFSWSVCTNEHVGEHDVSLLDAEQLSKFKKYCDSVYSLYVGGYAAYEPLVVFDGVYDFTCYGFLRGGADAAAAAAHGEADYANEMLLHPDGGDPEAEAEAAAATAAKPAAPVNWLLAAGAQRAAAAAARAAAAPEQTGASERAEAGRAAGAALAALVSPPPTAATTAITTSILQTSTAPAPHRGKRPRAVAVRPGSKAAAGAAAAPAGAAAAPKPPTSGRGKGAGAPKRVCKVKPEKRLEDDPTLAEDGFEVDLRNRKHLFCRPCLESWDTGLQKLGIHRASDKHKRNVAAFRENASRARLQPTVPPFVSHPFLIRS